MARLAYSALLWIALPFVLARLAWRARRQPGYLEHLGERFGGAPMAGGNPVIWVHAVSVGETRAAAPLVALLRRDLGAEAVDTFAVSAVDRSGLPELWRAIREAVQSRRDAPGAPSPEQTR